MTSNMDQCGICVKPAVQLFETGKEGIFACFKCQPLVPEVSLGQEQRPGQNLQRPEIESYPIGDQEANGAQLSCGICNKTFQKNIQLQNHLRNHRAERKFVCTYCNKAFSQSNNLRAHLRIHTNERPYKCKVCDKAFTQVTNLNNHVRLHTGERPFVCSEPGCGKAYAQVTNLNQHRKRHINGRGGDGVYSCPVCGMQFQQRNHMYSHRREVHGDTKALSTHVCRICDASFTSERKLVTHVAQHMMLHNAEQNGKDADNETSKEGEGLVRCVFLSCGARLRSAAHHTDHLLRAHQLRLFADHPDHAHLDVPRRRGRPHKTKIDPLDMKDRLTYDLQVSQLKQEHQYLPKLKVQSLFQ